MYAYYKTVSTNMHMRTQVFRGMHRYSHYFLEARESSHILSGTHTRLHDFVGMRASSHMFTGTHTVLSLINAPGALQFFKRGMFIRGKFSMQKCSG